MGEFRDNNVTMAASRGVAGAGLGLGVLNSGGLLGGLFGRNGGIGYNMIDQKREDTYSRGSSDRERGREDDKGSKFGKFDEAKAIWDWQNRMTDDKISDIKYKLSNYKR